MPARAKVSSKGAGIGPIQKSVEKLIRTRLLVGIPGDSAPRQPAPGEKNPPNNAVIGYLMETGDAEMNLPARPFLDPGVRAALPAITKGMTKAVVSALSGKPAEIKNGFDEAGLAAVASIQGVMIAGGFAPLSDRTIEARARRRNPDTGKLSGAATSRNARNFLKLRGEGVPDEVLHDAGLAAPLLDTRSLFRSVTYIVKQR
ncbi:MAG: hypothetical protein ACRYGP_30320 [Janthinobacterium lividum]